MENTFITASRKKYRFNYKGVITTEDLWDLSLKDLDSIYKTLRKQEKTESEEESLLTKKNEVDAEVSDKIKIVRYIVSVKMEEMAAAENAKEKAQKRQHIMEVIARKQEAQLNDMSIEDLTKLLED